MLYPAVLILLGTCSALFSSISRERSLYHEAYVVRQVGGFQTAAKRKCGCFTGGAPKLPKKVTRWSEIFFCSIRRNKSGEYYKLVQQMISIG